MLLLLPTVPSVMTAAIRARRMQQRGPRSVDEGGGDGDAEVVDTDTDADAVTLSLLS